jgi:hypothetical protein
LHVGHGSEYRGRKTKKGVVVYVAVENPEDVERRVRAWCDRREQAGEDVGDGAFVIHRGPCCLYDPNNKGTGDERSLVQIAKDASEHYGLPVAMIIIDTVSQSIAPGSNDRDHGGLFVSAMQRVATATGACVTALHRPTKAGDPVRSDGQFQGNVDTIILLSREASGRGTIKAGSKFRIGDPSKVNFGYRLKPFVIGRDDDGDDVSVVLAVEGHSALNLAVDDSDEDVPVLKRRDDREDRVEPEHAN